MKEGILENINEIVDLTKQGIINSVQILQIEAPQLIEQILLFGMIKYSMYIILSLLLFIIFLTCLCKIIIKLKKDEDIFGFVVSAGIAFVLFVPIFAESIVPFIKVMFAPKLYLIEYIRVLLG